MRAHTVGPHTLTASGTRPLSSRRKSATPSNSGVPRNWPRRSYVQPWYRHRSRDALPAGSIATRAARCRHTLINAPSSPASFRTATTGVPAISAVTNWPGIGDLFRSANDLPGRVEHGTPLEPEDFRVGVPVGGNRPGCGQRQIWIERREFFCQSGHARQCSRMSFTAKHFGRRRAFGNNQRRWLRTPSYREGPMCRPAKFAWIPQPGCLC